MGMFKNIIKKLNPFRFKEQNYEVQIAISFLKCNNKGCIIPMGTVFMAGKNNTKSICCDCYYELRDKDV